jgi:hypothetical protein
MPNYEEIQRAYEEGAMDGLVDGCRVLVVPGESELAVIPSAMLLALVMDHESMVRQLDDIKTERSMEWFSARGFDDKLIGPETEEVSNHIEHQMENVGLVAENIAHVMKVLGSDRPSTYGHVIRGAGKRSDTMVAGFRSPSGTIGVKSRAARPSASAAGALRHKRKPLQSA